MPEFNAIVEALLAPCAGTAVGIDARYEPLHESIRSRVASLDTPNGEPVEWPEIVTDSSALLATSKDLVIASFLAFGWFRERALGGLRDGLDLVSQIADRYWDDVFPTRVKARANALRWLTERVVPRMVDIPVGPTDHDLVAGLETAAARLATVVGERFGDNAPAMRPLVEATKRLALSLPPRPATPEPAPSALDSEAVAPGASGPVEAPALAAAPSSASAPVAADAVAADVVAVDAVAADVVAESAAASTSRLEENANRDVDAAQSGEVQSETPPEDPLASARARVATLLTPIAPDNAAGDDARYDPIHEQVRAETAKLDTPTGGEVDWDEVVANCEELLRDKSKDILIASFWAYGRYVQDGLEGVTDGLTLLTGVIDTYWEGAQPAKKREKARANAVTWLVDRLGELSARQLTASDEPRVAALELAAKEFGRVVGGRFENHFPPIRPLATEVERLRLSLPKAAPPPPKAAPPSPVKPPVASAAPPVAAKAPVVDVPAVAAPSGADDLQPFLRKTGAALHQAGRLLFNADPSDPSGYRLSRMGLFVHLTNPPPSPDGVKTSIPPPPAKLVLQLETILGSSNWAALLEEAESATATYRFWLDLQRYVALALTNLGHVDARDAALAELRSLLQRMPSLTQLTFGNSQPLCSDATREWLSTEVLAVSSAAQTEVASSESNEMASARQTAAKGALDDALTQLEELASQAPSERIRFEARLTMAELLGRGAAVAVDGLCTSLAHDADRFGLDYWDPELASRLYRTHLDALDGLATNTKNNISERRVVVYSRLCRVAPLVALKRR